MKDGEGIKKNKNNVKRVGRWVNNKRTKWESEVVEGTEEDEEIN